jgi:hypothetical protein
MSNGEVTIPGVGSETDLSEGSLPALNGMITSARIKHLENYLGPGGWSVPACELIGKARQDSTSNIVTAHYWAVAGLFNSALTSPDQDFSIYLDNPHQYDINGPVDGQYKGWWPTASNLETYYLGKVPVSAPFPDNVLDAAASPTPGPIYHVGDLTLGSTANGNTMKLMGTIYVTGKLDTSLPSGKTFTLDLNGQTIFCDSSSLKPPKEAVYLDSNVTIIGTGAIIALGDIYFHPNVSTNPDDYVLLMSVDDDASVNVQPQNNASFTGSMVGNNIDLQPNTTVTYHPPKFPIDFPTPPSGSEYRSWQLRDWKSSK